VSSNQANALSTPPGKYGRKTKTQRNRRGPAQAVEHVVQFDGKRGTLPGLEMLGVSRGKPWGTVKSDPSIGAARLSSARGLNRSIKLGNERNPRPVLYFSQETAHPFVRGANNI